MTDQDFQTFVIDSLNALKTDVQGLKTDVQGLKTDVQGLKTDVQGLKTDVQGLKTDVQGLRDEFYDFREEQRPKYAVLRALSAQSFQHISDIKAEMMPTWKAGNAWKANV